MTLKVKVTIEVQGTLDQKEIDGIARATSMGVLAKYSERIDSMTDNSFEQLFGSIVRTKLFIIADEDRKEVQL